MAKRIHIKIADRGWILEKCAREIAERGTEITYGTEPDTSARLQYYINYSARSRRISPTEVAFFTHSENDSNARRRYFEAAKEVEHCVCMSDRYARELIESGMSPEKVTTIAPGVDLEQFRPMIRVGVIGRTYHTGRKGEALVADVMDVPGVEWRFTGSGWPGTAMKVPESRMADFYNDLDYVLVPSIYEGGPMSVLEGLACGVPIISSDVGWVPDYPHIPFENGNASSLREVLSSLVKERDILRSSVLDRTWQNWADEHLKLFDQLLGKRAGQASTSSKVDTGLAVTLVTHGSEGKALGGPSVRVPRTATELTKLGVAAGMPGEHVDNFDESSIAHVFNIWPPDSCFKVLDRAHAVGKATVLSPIFLNLSNLDLASKTLPRLFSEGHSPATIDAALSEIAKEIAQEPNLPIREPFEGFHERVRVCVESADEVILLSDYERRCLEHIGARPRSTSLVRNPVDGSSFANADPALFAESLGIDDYILCVGRIEPRKNQLLLAHAAKTMGKTVVFIGHTEKQAYLDLVRAAAGQFGRFIPRIDPADPLLKSAFAGASVFCLPSWAEGAPLAALEAAAAGVPLVLSDRSSEPEYFGEFAKYVNPADVGAMREALEKAASTRDDATRRAELRNHIADNFNWDKYARETAQAYEKIGSTRAQGLRGVADDPNPTIYFDLTTTFHTSGNPTGIARVERRALEALIAEDRDRVVPIVWNSRTKTYVRLSRAIALVGADLAELERLEATGELHRVTDAEAKGGRILVLGGSWIRNREYISALQGLKRQLGANLTILVHDLIQMKLAHLYPPGIGQEFEDNARVMTSVADDFLVYSEFTRSDLRDFLIANGEYFKKISQFRLGDMTGLHPDSEASDEISVSDLQGRFSGQSFAIYVSSIDLRKNHVFLINVWRRLIEERGAAAPHLLFIGRPLWRGDEVIDAVKRDEKLSRHVHILSDVDDRDLDWFYRNCLLTLYPSLYEGWGLPVAESLSYGKVCIASDRTATREIAPKLTDLVDPYDFRAWLDRIAFYVDNPAALARAEEKVRSEYTEYSWEQSVGEITAILDGLPHVRDQLPMVFPKESVEFFAGAANDKGVAVCAGGWSNPERNGRWSVGQTSTLVFRYPASREEFHVRLRMWGLARSGQETRSVRVRINDQDSWLLDVSTTPSIVDFTIPVQRHESDGHAHAQIVFEPVELYSPKMIGPSNDVRLLGIYIVSAQVADNLADLSAPPTAPAGRAQSGDALNAARDLVVLPAQFTGKKPFARFARLIGFDKLWLRMHQRQFRRAYKSIGLIIDHLQAQKR